MIECILPLNYYSDMAGIMIDGAILVKFLHSYIPEFNDSIIANGFELHLNNLIYTWLVSAFAQGIPDNVMIDIN